MSPTSRRRPRGDTLVRRAAILGGLGWLEARVAGGGVLGLGEKRIPLVAALTDVGDDEVPLWADVDLVSHFTVVWGFVVQLPRINSVA